jgi:hypothetical protein
MVGNDSLVFPAVSRGGLATAKYLINSPTPSVGYTHLYERARLDLTVFVSQKLSSAGVRRSVSVIIFSALFATDCNSDMPLCRPARASRRAEKPHHVRMGRATFRYAVTIRHEFPDHRCSSHIRLCEYEPDQPSNFRRRNIQPFKALLRR